MLRAALGPSLRALLTASVDALARQGVRLRLVVRLHFPHMGPAIWLMRLHTLGGWLLFSGFASPRALHVVRGVNLRMRLLARPRAQAQDPDDPGIWIPASRIRIPGSGSRNPDPGIPASRLPGSGSSAGEVWHEARHRMKNGMPRRLKSRHPIFCMSRGHCTSYEARAYCVSPWRRVEPHYSYVARHRAASEVHA